MPHYTSLGKNTSFRLKDRDKLQELLKKSDAVITVETWLESYAGVQEYDNVLEAILRGKFDHHINQLAGLVNNTPRIVYVRLNPDM